MRLVDIEPLFDKYDKMNEGTEFSPIHFMNDLAALPVVESCEDSVSKEDVLRILEKAYEDLLFAGWTDYCTVCDWVDDLPSVKPQTVTDFTDKCKECGKILNEKNQQKWIPVSEKMPPIAQRVLVSATNGEVFIARYHSFDKWTFEPTGISYAYNKDSIVAWMPLPQPYKAESEDSK